MAKETPVERLAREDAERLAAATAPAGADTSEAVSASNVAATEAAAAVTVPAAEAATGNPTPNPDKTRPGDRAAEDQTVGKRAKPSKSFDLRERFLELSGYTKADIIGSNDERRTIVTANGGKYEVSKKGTRLRKLSGPDTPADREAAAEEDDE
jgi:hypothetical protein